MNQKNFLTMAGLAAIVIILFILLFSGGSAPQQDASSDVPNNEPTEMGDPASTDADSESEDADEPEAVTIDVTGEPFAFSEKIIQVPLGTEVTINFESAVGTHDWVVDEFDARTEIVSAGEGASSVTFTADQAGEFEYYCSVGTHRASGMVGTLIVE